MQEKCVVVKWMNVKFKFKQASAMPFHCTTSQPHRTTMKMRILIRDSRRIS